jgi:hypothetical protein
MDPTAIQAGPPAQRPGSSTAIQEAAPRPVALAPQRPAKGLARRGVEVLASLRITVVLFLLSLLLVFYGTLAQVDNGIWTIVKQYFRSGYVKIPTSVMLLHANRIWGTNAQGEPNVQFPGWIPYPGGWLLGGLLLVNLLAAHAIRFKISWKRSGILLIHAGLIVMMLGELVTGLFAIEGMMQIEEGHASNAVIHGGVPELAFERITGTKEDEVIVIPASLLRPGTTIKDAHLPVALEVKDYMVNSDVEFIKEPWKDNPATAGNGLYYRAVPVSEVSGVSNEQKHDAPSAYVVFRDPSSGKELNTYLMTLHLRPEWIKIGDKEYQVSLRFKHTYRPYSLILDKFDYKKFVGTEMAKDYRSHITLDNPATGEKRNLEIYMNAPLRYDGETFYQSGVLQDPPGPRGRVTGTILQVVRNPGWLLPYLSCCMVSFGMLLHFGMNLFRFIERRAA